MELWIRSQDKLKLVKVNYVYAIENKINSFSIYGETIDSAPIIGRYETKERAIEVLDEIQSLLQPTIEYKPIVQEEYNPAYTYKHFVKVDDNIEIKELSTVVYQMPAE